MRSKGTHGACKLISLRKEPENSKPPTTSRAKRGSKKNGSKVSPFEMARSRNKENTIEHQLPLPLYNIGLVKSI